MKVCNKCGKELSINNFAKKKYRSGTIGIVGICKGCENARRRAKYKPVIRENDKLYEQGKRRCKKCSIIKPLSDYGRYTAGKGGIKSICKECNRIRCRDWKRENADRINEGRRERTANDPEYKDRINGLKKQWRIDNREHYLKRERENAKRRYWENPGEREKNQAASRRYRENRTDEQIQRDRERYYQHWIDNKEKLMEYRTKWRHNRRKTCIEKLGGKCVKCGTTKYLQFDHIKPSEKSFDISRKLTTDLKTLFEELDKCQLLCWDCHMEKTKNDWLSGELYKGISKER
jgi:hypothetical protein